MTIRTFDSLDKMLEVAESETDDEVAPHPKRSVADIEASIEWHRIMRTQNEEVFRDLEEELRNARKTHEPISAPSADIPT